MSSPRPVFLRAEWRSLVVLSYAVDPALLASRLPHGVELDLWQGEALVSLVGFRFLRTRVLGIALPGHQDFEEVNFRFYVRRQLPDGWRRGVVFIREIVPKHLIAFVARVVYDEPYIALPMCHRLPEPGAGGSFEYGWKIQSGWCALGAETVGDPAVLAPGGPEDFIFEHYWGYTQKRNGKTAEYQVEHPPWKAWQTTRSWFEGDVGALYGSKLARALTETPRSAFVAEGSDVLVRRGSTIG